MRNFKVPTREEVSADNQAIFDQLQSKLGFVPNLYAYYAKNPTALGDYLTFQNRKSTLKAKEREVVNLVVSEFNGCAYCLSAHTQIAKLNGFNEDQILQIRAGEAHFDNKLNALAQFTLSALNNRGKATDVAINNLLEAGYSEENIIDIAIVIGDKTISNYIHNIADFAIDFPVAQSLNTVEA